MRYWTLITLRILARVGLSAAVLLAIIGQSGPIRGSAAAGSTCFVGRIEPNTLVAQCHRNQVLMLPKNGTHVFEGDNGGRVSVTGFQLLVNSGSFAKTLKGLEPESWVACVLPDTERPVLNLPGIDIEVHKLQSAGIRADHRLLCLTFLLATIATSVRWKKSVTEPDRKPSND